MNTSGAMLTRRTTPVSRRCAARWRLPARRTGYTGDICCKDCGAVLTPGKAIPAAGHVGGTEVRGKKDADCTHDGYTGDTYCKVCDAKIATVR